jgi:hypothetical protein
VRYLIGEHLKRIAKLENLPDQSIRALAGEKKYEVFVKGILKKI